MILFHYAFAKKTNIFKLWIIKLKSKFRKNNKLLNQLSGMNLIVSFSKIKVAGTILIQVNIKMNKRLNKISYNYKKVYFKDIWTNFWKA